jgi:hypothetical protein
LSACRSPGTVVEGRAAIWASVVLSIRLHGNSARVASLCSTLGLFARTRDASRRRCEVGQVQRSYRYVPAPDAGLLILALHVSAAVELRVSDALPEIPTPYLGFGGSFAGP